METNGLLSIATNEFVLICGIDVITLHNHNLRKPSRYSGHNFYYFLRKDKKISEIMDRSRPRGLVIMDKSRYPGHNFYYFLREDKKISEIMDRSRPFSLFPLQNTV